MHRRFSPMGRLLLGTFVLGAIFGINTRATVAYQLAALALAVLVLALVWAPGFRPRLAVSRRLPAYAQVGERCTCTVLIKNEGARPTRGLVLLDELAPSSDIWRSGRDGMSADDRRRNWFDRKVGYPRWAGLMRRAVGARIAPVEIPIVETGGRGEARVSFTPFRRGYLRFTCSRILRPDPLGVFYAQQVFTSPGSLLVLPRRHPVAWPEVRAPHARQDLGTADSKRHGGVEEFASIREYRPGDSRRYLHWRGWARYGYPVVKEFYDQRNSRPAVMLDSGLSATAPLELFEAAVEVAASLVAAPGRGECTLVIGGENGQWLEAGRDVQAELTQLEALACVLPNEDGLAGLHAVTSAHLDILEQAIFVCTRWSEEHETFTEKLEADGVPLRVVVVHETGRRRDQRREISPPAGTLFIRADDLAADLAAVGAEPVR